MNGDISWPHRNNKDAEWNAFVADNASEAGLPAVEFYKRALGQPVVRRPANVCVKMLRHASTP